MKLFARSYVWCGIIVALICLSEIPSAHVDTVYAEEGSATRFVSETGRTMRGPFLHYWESHGALPSFGHPITDEIEEGGLLVQYFERARLEYHPENAGSEYEVLLGHLGLQLTSARDFPPATFIPPASSGINYFAETRHSLGGEFLDYWRLQGGLERFGYPISEELSETSTTDRRTYTVQYFERARFEFHPDNVEPYRVLLGQLGREMLRLRDKASRFVQVVDGQLVSGQSLTPLKLKGFNYFPRDYGWTDFGAWPTDRVEHELEQAERLGANTLRVFIRYDAFGGAAEGWRKQEGFANFVRMAKAHGLYLLVSLFDGSRKVPQTGWDNWPAPGTPEDAQDKAYLAAVITPWKNETTILGWDVYNEPDHVTELEWRWDEHRANRVYWLARMATEVRRLDPNHPLTVGVAIADSNLLPGRGGMNMLDIVDFVSVHYYKRNYGGKSAASVLRDLKKLTRKPILIEEAGESTLDNPDGDAEQARFLAQVMRDAIETDTSGVLIWTLYDFPTHSTNSEGYYGVLRADDTPKPAAAIFSQH